MFFRYLGWTKKYKKVHNLDFDDFKLCKICKIASKKEKHSINDIYKWWEVNANCTLNFAEKLIR